MERMEQWTIDLRNSVTQGAKLADDFGADAEEIDAICKVYPMRIPAVLLQSDPGEGRSHLDAVGGVHPRIAGRDARPKTRCMRKRTAPCRG